MKRKLIPYSNSHSCMINIIIWLWRPAPSTIIRHHQTRLELITGSGSHLGFDKLITCYNFCPRESVKTCVLTTGRWSLLEPSWLVLTGADCWLVTGLHLDCHWCWQLTGDCPDCCWLLTATDTSYHQCCFPIHSLDPRSSLFHYKRKIFIFFRRLRVHDIKRFSMC